MTAKYALGKTFEFNRRALLRISFGWALASQTYLCGADDWAADVKKMLSEFLACREPIDDQSPCNVFLGRALKRVFGISDFEDPSHPGSFINANQIATYVAVDSKWTSLGKASDQNNLTQAQGYANLKKAVVAVYTAPSHGHVCMILPGSLQMSTTWGLKVPNSASFFLYDPKSSYVGGPLSKAFGADKKDQVTLYGRNF